MMLTGMAFRWLKPEDILEMGFSKAALSGDLYEHLEEKETRQSLKKLSEAGIELIAGELEKTKYNNVLNTLEVGYAYGAAAGGYASEDDIILPEVAVRAQ